MIPICKSNKVEDYSETIKLPLSSNQKRLWIIYQINKNNPAYNLSFTYSLDGKIIYEMFEKAMGIFCNRHISMFSVFKQIDGDPYCEIILDQGKVDFIDFTSFPLHIRKKEIFRFSSEDSRMHFDLENGPLFRFYLLKFNDEYYYFHATIHHIIFDGWSWNLFVKEFSQIYNCLINNIEIRLSPVNYQILNYINQEENKESSIRKTEKLNIFWKRYLKESPFELKFPYDYPRKNISSGLGGRVKIVIPAKFVIKLKQLSKKENSTLFVALLSVTSILFQKYSGEDDICIGIPFSNRTHPGLDRLVGMFVNMIVIRFKEFEDSNFRQSIKNTKNVFLKTIVHQGLPFNKIVEVVNPERRLNMNPLFQVSLVWANNMTSPFSLNGIKSKRISLSEGGAPFDITIYLWEDGNYIIGEIEYNVDILRKETIIRLKKNFLELIKNLTQHPDLDIGSIALITDSEQQQILRCNGTRTEYPKDRTIVQLFEEQVKLYHNKIAVVFKDSLLTYEQLNERGNQLARTLRSMGIKNDVPVGVFLDKSLEMIVGILGILKAGGAYLPMDPEYPIQRIDFIIKETGCKILLTQSKYMGVPIKEVNKLNLNSPDTYHAEKTNVKNINASSDLAYLMYTSGTTGAPKGIMIRHYSVLRTVCSVNYMQMTSADRILFTSSITFDVTTYEIWGALLNGMTLFVVEKETILDAKALGKELHKNNITILHLTSALFTQLAEIRTDIFAGLKYLLVGGDILSAHHINKVRNNNPKLKIINCYGPSENTTYSTTYLIDKTHEMNIPIGKSISNSTVYIFDKSLNYQPIGVMGELYVGGDGLSRGYLNREDLNRTSFINHPFNPGEKLYKTGDFGKWLPDGNIEFCGRMDNQLKIRGYRVELEEIESVISEIEGVIETVIKPVKVEEGDYILVAYLNVPETFKIDIIEINRRVKEKLPSYMIPSAYKFKHAFPKTINGKTDRKALIVEIKELEIIKRQEKGDISASEKEIYNIWCEALKTRDILASDNFFDIGGNSLLAISVFSKINKVFKTEMELRIFFDSPRIVDLAIAVQVEKLKQNKNLSDYKRNRKDFRNIIGEL